MDFRHLLTNYEISKWIYQTSHLNKKKYSFLKTCCLMNFSPPPPLCQLQYTFCGLSTQLLSINGVIPFLINTPEIHKKFTREYGDHVFVIATSILFFLTKVVYSLSSPFSAIKSFPQQHLSILRHFLVQRLQTLTPVGGFLPRLYQLERTYNTRRS